MRLFDIVKYCEMWTCDFLLEFEIATRGEINSCIWLQRNDRENDQMDKKLQFFRVKRQFVFYFVHFVHFFKFYIFLICIA